MGRSDLCQSETRDGKEIFKIIFSKSDSDDEFDFNEKKSLDEGKDIEDNEEEDDDTFDEDKLTEESYRTTFDSEPEDLDLEAEDVADDEEF